MSLISCVNGNYVIQYFCIGGTILTSNLHYAVSFQEQQLNLSCNWCKQETNFMHVISYTQAERPIIHCSQISI